MRILIIDDEASIREMLGRSLEAAGYEVTLAPDGVEGTKLFRQAPTDLVITDLFMPNKEGIETIQELRRDYPDVGIIAMCGSGPHAGAMLSVAEAVGATEVLHKPFSFQELLIALERTMRPNVCGSAVLA